MKNVVLLLLISLFSISYSLSADRFWVGGSGNWSDVAHWSATTSGPGGETVPTSIDDVFLDAGSSIIVATIINLDVAVDINSLDYSAVAAPFTFNSIPQTVVIRGSIAGNAAGAAFTGGWNGIDLNTTLAGESITSGGTVWVQNFTTTGEMISLDDDFNNGLNVFQIDSGGVDMNGHAFECGSFASTTIAPRTIDISNSSITINEGAWSVDTTNLAWTSGGSEIFMGDDGTGVGSFIGGSLPYDTLRSVSATNFSYAGNNSFDWVELIPSSTFILNNADTLSTDSLTAAGSCLSRLIISTSGIGANAVINKTGFNTLSLSGLEIINVGAAAPATYDLTFSALLNATGWTNAPGEFFWIGDGGNWNDLNHWSFTSGGAVAGCLPYISDSVFFDANSFTLTGQEVVIDDTAFFGAMHWDGIFGNQALLLDSNIYGYGDVVFHPNLSVRRNVISGAMLFNAQADLFANGASIDCSFSVIMSDPTESLLLQDDLVMSDTSSIILFNGRFSTENNALRTGTIFTANDPLTGLDNRELNFGSSEILLLLQFSALGDTNLVLNAGTSSLFIGDTLGYDNGLSTEGLTFHDVTLNFQPLNIGPFALIQPIKGANTFNKLRITEGSHVYLDTIVSQTINDSLIMQGNCLDSIWLRSLDTSPSNVQALITKTSSADIISECVNVGGINFTNPSITTFFSTDLGNNSNWIFSATNSTDANFTFTGQGGSFCFGDTVFFNNTSTAFSGNTNDIVSVWAFGDGSSFPGIDSTGFVADTNAHVFLGSGDFDVSLITTFTNFCTDTITQVVTTNRPVAFLSSSDFNFDICPGEEVTFETSSTDSLTAFEFFVNGVSVLGPGINDTLFVTSTLNNNDTISVQGFLNGCASDSIPQQVYTLKPVPTFTMTSSDADTSICAGDLVSFTGIGGDSTDLFQYQVNGINVTSSTLDSTYSSSTLADNDVVTLFGQNTLGCKDSAFMTFNVDALPTTSLTSTELGTIICQGTNVTFTASGATTYEFFLNGVSQGAASATTTFSTATLTAVDVVTVIGYDPNGCSFQAPQSFTYSILATPAITMTSSDIDFMICSGENVTFSASGGVTYEFFINGISQGPASPINTLSTSGLLNGQTVTVVGALGGCTGISSGMTFVVIPSPSTVLTSSDANDSICQGDLVTFTGSGATNYEFLLDGVSQGPSSPTNTFATSLLINGQTITLRGESNGCIVEDQLTYTVLSTPAVTLFSNDGDNMICDGESIIFVSANAATYQLYVNGNPFGGPQALSAFINPALPIGTNTVYVEGTASNGCISNSLPALSVTVNPIPVVVNTSSDLDDIICAGELVTFTGSGSDDYQFFIDGVAQTTMSSNPTFATTSLSDGQSIEILGSSLGCSSSSNVITMTVNTVPVVTLTNTDPNNIWCADEVITFEATGAANYEFIVDGTSQGASSPANTINSATFAVGSYTVQVIGEQSNCFGSASMGIVINPLPVPTLASSDADDIICEGESVTYTAGGGGTYEFFIDGISQGITSGINTFTSSTFVNGNVVSVIVTSSGGCTEQTTWVPLTVNPIPAVSLVSSDIDFTICVGESVTFTGSGASDYEFFLNGTSQGPLSATTTFTTTSLANGDVVSLTGSLLGCVNTPPSLTFTVFDFPVVSLVNNGDIQICAGELTDLTASGATDYQFLINGTPTGPFSTNANLSTALLNGDVVTVTGELNGCPTTSASSFTFTVFDFPTLSSSSSDADNIICLDELITFTGSGAMTYDFALNGNVLQSGALATFDINTLLDGDVITITGFNGDCPSTADTYVHTVNSMNLDLVASPSNMICEGDAVTFTASGGDNYEFFLNGVSTGPISATTTFTSSTLSNLDEVTITANNTTTVCTQVFSDYIVMNVIDEPSITALSPTDFCDGDSVILVSGAAHGNQWLLNGAIIPGATDTSYVAYVGGVYSLEATSGGVGTVWSFGQNASGTIGNGENLNSADPAISASTEVFDELTTGYDFILGVTTAGDLFSWGDNSSGQLGDGTYTSTNIPQAVPTLANIKTAATSESSAMAVDINGDVFVWGNNSQGQLATGNTSVINFPFLNATLANTDSIAGGRDHFVILKNDGTVWAVGNNDFGQLGQDNLIASLNAVQVPGLANIVSVGAGEYQSFAIDNTGALFAWGNNGSGQLGLGDLNNRLVPALSDLTNIINAQGGASHSAFLSSTNKVFTAGANGFGQLGSTNFVASTLPLEVDVQGATMISTGQYTTLIKRTDKSVFGFGNNTEDQLSSVTGLTVPTPEHIVDLDGVEFIEAGRFTSHVIYNEDQTCVSAGTTVNILAAPAVTITTNVDTLIATAGVSYQWYLNGSVIPGATNQSHVVTATGDYFVEVTFASGCVGTSPAQPHSAVGIEDLAFGKVTLYPNPANNQVNLTFSADVLDNTTYLVTDQAGRIVSNGEIINSNTTLDISELENGLYNLIISNDYTTRSLRFVKSLK